MCIRNNTHKTRRVVTSSYLLLWLIYFIAYRPQHVTENKAGDCIRKARFCVGQAVFHNIKCNFKVNLIYLEELVGFRGSLATFWSFNILSFFFCNAYIV